MRKLVLVVIAITLLNISGYSQVTPNPADYSQVADIFPPAPNAASLGKYGGINFGISTGTMSTLIPVYQYSSTNIKVPISISYQSNGIRVDEIAGRIGTSWNLQAGGVITRTVIGKVDGEGIRIKPPADYPSFTVNYLNFLESLSDDNESGADAAPDMFSFNFNGISGQFIVDSNYQPLQLAHSGLKFESDIIGTAWNFKITDLEGIQYYFGGDSATEYTSRSTGGPGCGKSHVAGIPTAYYLKRIIHPNNDIVNFVYSAIGFTYDAGITQTMYAFYPYSYLTCPGDGVNPPNLTNSSCANTVISAGVLLKEINSVNGGKIKFAYISRSDISDKLLSKIEIFPPGTTDSIKAFSFEYIYSYATSHTNSFTTTAARYRPFLSKFIERSIDSSLTKTHQFFYDDFNSLPPRLSFSQDDYGFYNGKNNSTLIPVPPTLYAQYELTLATANRSADSTSVTKGLLNKIIYPTGGYDSIVYEINTSYVNVEIPMTAKAMYVAGHSEDIASGEPTEIAYDTARIYEDQPINLTAYCWYTGIPANYDPIHCKAVVSIIDSATNTAIYQYSTLSCGDDIHVNGTIRLYAGHTYYLKIASSGYKTSADATLDYKGDSIMHEWKNKQVAGARVKRIITISNAGTNSIVKRYYYSSLSSPAQSSGGVIYTPSYYKFLGVSDLCSGSSSFSMYYFLTMHSSSIQNIYAYSAAPMSYHTVVESYGENFENGGVEYAYSLFADVQAETKTGDKIMGAPVTSYSWKNGRELSQYIFKKQGSFYLPVKKILNHYKDDTRIDTSFVCFLANKRFTYPYSHTPPWSIEKDPYDLSSYTIYKKWTYIDTVRTLSYDVKGQNYLEQIVATAYGNTSHALPTKASTYSSDQTLNTANTYYPQDLTLTGPEETARQALVTKHIIGPALLQEVLNGSDTLYKIKTNYFSYPDNVVLPQYHFTKTLAYAFEKRVEFQKYNKYGQIVEQAKANDFKTTYLWDYHSLYPVAEIKKADSAGVAYTSFEGDSKGGWTYSGSVSADASAPTGGYCYNTTGGNITRSGLTSTTYVVSYWGKNGSVSVNSGSPGVSGRALGNWTYYEHEITGSSITLSGNKYIDEVRLYPKGAMMTTYTFNPLIGMTSQCDINNRIVYYEYDGLGRLVLVRDQDKNIIKKICYNYAGQEESCDVYFNVEKSSNYTRNNCGAGYEGTLVTYTVVAGTYSAHTQSGADSVAQNDVNANGQSYANSHGSCLLIYYNVIKSGNFTRNDCGTGYTGSTVTYTVSANTYNSTISQAYVDSVAQADVNANGQTYANANGTCTSNCNSSNCTGNNKKCINGVCETGVKVYTDGFQKPNGTWQCTYHYEWSDSSWSQDFIETRPSNNPCPCSC